MVTKLAIIIDNIANNAGTERAVTSLCNGLLKFYPEFYEITIVSIFSQNKEHSFFELNSKINVHHLEKKKNFKFWNKFFWYKHLVNKISEINKENGYQIILGTTYVHNLLLPIIVKKTKSRTIGCEHVVYDYPPKLFQFLRKFVYFRLNSLVVLNDLEQRNFYFLKNTSVIPNSLPFDNNKKAILTNKSIIAVGRLTNEKGQDILIDIYEKSNQDANNWKLNIFGEGEDFETLKAKIKSKGLESSILLQGSVKNISECYLQNSIFVLCSRTESFGIAIIEAMNHGLPIISFDCDGPKNIIENNKSGFLIPKFDINEFSNKLLVLMNDEMKRKEMGEEAFVASLKYNETNILPIWNKLIQLVLEEPV